MSVRAPAFGVLAVLLIAGLLTGCGMIPRPFQPEAKIAPETINQRLGARAGIVVRAVRGVPSTISDYLVDSLVAKLQANNVPASARFSNRASMTLAGEADTAPAAVRWLLTDANGAIVLEFAQASPQATWQEVTVLDAAALADGAAARIAGHLQPPELAQGTGRGWPPVVVWAVEGAPGDGDRTLAAAMRRALLREGVAVNDALGDETYLVIGSVHVEPPRWGEERVEIAWTMMGPDGARVGTVTQDNTVPEGALDGPWGPVARAVADAGTPAIIAMLERVAQRPD